MAHALQTTVAKLRRLAGWSALAERTDRQLVEAFAATGDEAAFAALVRRHGALVLGVTRRVLGNLQDAEDAFQATFLVLARKAGAVAWQDSIRNWLHGVAYRVAHKARTQGARRRLKESHARSEPSPAAAESWHELRGILDEELCRLPAKYRAPLILCYLEGKTRDEAAEELGWSSGSIKGRLERGRELLRQRLCGRGLTLPAALCAGFLLDRSAFASAPAALAQAATHAGVQFATGNVAGLASPILNLAQGVIQAMLIAKLKIASLALSCLLVVGLGGAWVVQTATADGVGVRGVGPNSGEFGDSTEPIFFQEREQKKEREERRDERATPGIIKALDLKAGTITIQGVRDGDSGVQTFNLAGKDVRVTTPAEAPTKLSDLKAGLRVLLSLNENNDVQAIRVEPVMRIGFLVKADAESRTITVRLPREGERAAPATLKLAPEVRITINGRPGELAGLESGQRVQLMLDFAGETVLALQAVRPERDGERPPVRRDGERPKEREGDGRARLQGTIIAVDQAKSTINVLIGRDTDPTISTYAVSKETPIRATFLDRPVQDLSLAQLTKPVNAVVTLAEDKTVAAINIVTPMQRGRIKSVDAAKRTVTIGLEREEQTLELAPDAKVMIGRREVKLADIEAGATAMLGLSFDRRHVIGIVIVPAERERE